MADPGNLQYFQTALMNLVSKANKLRLTLHIGMGISSLYNLTTNMPGDHPYERLRSEVHIVTPEAQTKPSIKQIPQDHPKTFERRRQRKHKGFESIQT